MGHLIPNHKVHSTPGIRVQQLLAPNLFPTEICNVLMMAERTGKILPGDANALFMDFLRDLPSCTTRFLSCHGPWQSRSNSVRPCTTASMLPSRSAKDAN